jgi:CheY-like chemotaxis protein
VRLTVADTGVGMDEATQARIFEPFFTTKARGKGTGLGLATVYGVVTQAGGVVRVASARGVGSTFSIYLPRVDAAAHAAAQSARRTTPTGLPVVSLAGRTEAGRPEADRAPAGRADAGGRAPAAPGAPAFGAPPYGRPGQGAPGQGATGRGSAVPAAAPAPSAAARSAAVGETVLLVEDDHAVRGIARAALTRHGYQVLTAGDAVEALAVARAFPAAIHLLLTDVVMPGMGGRELAERVTAERPGVRVLFMSGYTEDEVLHRGVSAEAMAFVPKPFTPEGLAAKVRAVLDAPAGPGV